MLSPKTNKQLIFSLPVLVNWCTIGLFLELVLCIKTICPQDLELLDLVVVGSF